MDLSPTRLARPLTEPADQPIGQAGPVETLAGASLRFTAGLLDDAAADKVEQIADYADELAALVRHMDLHSTYRYGGYAKMTTDQRALYRALTGWGPDGPPVIRQPDGEYTPIVETDNG